MFKVNVDMARQREANIQGRGHAHHNGALRGA